LIEHPPSFSIYKFLFNLPPKIADSNSLLQYGLKTNDYQFLFQVFHDRLKQPLNALNILFIFHQKEEFFSNFFYSCSEEKINWIFVADSNGYYPRLEFLLESSFESIPILFDNLPSFRPILSESQMFQGILNSLRHKRFLYPHVHYLALIDQYKKIKVEPTNKSLKFLLSTIFQEPNDDTAHKDKLEQILLQLLENSIPHEAMKVLISPCQQFKYSKAANFIFTKIGVFDKALKKKTNIQQKRSF
jgi:hypothetical protein